MLRLLIQKMIGTLKNAFTSQNHVDTKQNHVQNMKDIHTGFILQFKVCQSWFERVKSKEATKQSSNPK